MSSNMIKGYAIRYDMQNYKKLNFPEKEEKIKENVKALWLQQFPDEKFPGEEDEEEFKLGLDAEEVEEESQDVIMSAEEIEDYKNRLRNEVRLEVRRELEEEIRTDIFKESTKILDDASRKSQSMIASAVERAKEEGEAAKAGIIALASTQGYEDGMKRAQAERDEMVAALEAEKVQLIEDYNKQVSELEPAFVEILKNYVKKITGVTYDNHNEVLAYLLDSAISKCPKDNRFEVKLSPEDFERLEPEFEMITERYADNLSLHFSSSASQKKGEIILENDDKIIECGVEINLKGLLDALDLLSLNE